MEYKLIIKNYNGLYIIYLTKLYKVLVKVVNRVIVSITRDTYLNRPES